jgi:hypothetical protein
MTSLYSRRSRVGNCKNGSSLDCSYFQDMTSLCVQICWSEASRRCLSLKVARNW